ncbi:MAG: class I SAM-dependent methyltransferase [Fibrobacteria bacterium]|nr:class I SAM-dependent methyltransferase [Fibrobacteria bacterium]
MPFKNPNKKLYKSIDECRICASKNLESILDLGEQPPANSLRKSLSENLPAIPLSISRCLDCHTVQLNETVDPEYLFKDYVWVTGTSATAGEYSQRFCQEMEKRCAYPKLSVLEIASNDGTFLKVFKERGHTVLGVDPAENIAAIANEAGIPTIADFFGNSTANTIVKEHGKVDCVFARNVLPHVPFPADVIKGMATALKDNGTGVIEFHHASAILDELHYDSIYHEHMSYFSIHNVSSLLERFHCYSFDLINSPISGGSIVLYFSKEKRDKSIDLTNAMRQEEQIQTEASEKWQQFATAAVEHRERLLTILSQEKESGKKIIGYGASARSSTLLNFCGINNKHLDCIADMSPFKQSRYTPGSDILILHPDDAFLRRPDTVVLLAWNFKDEIISFLKNEIGFHGKVIIPLPHMPEIINL